jgi:hypothetical protein
LWNLIWWFIWIVYAKTSWGIFSGDVGTVDGDDGIVGNGFHIKSNNEVVIGSNVARRLGGSYYVSING